MQYILFAVWNHIMHQDIGGSNCTPNINSTADKKFSYYNSRLCSLYMQLFQFPMLLFVLFERSHTFKQQKYINSMQNNRYCGNFINDISNSCINRHNTVRLAQKLLFNPINDDSRLHLVWEAEAMRIGWDFRQTLSNMKMNSSVRHATSLQSSASVLSPHISKWPANALIITHLYYATSTQWL